MNDLDWRLSFGSPRTGRGSFASAQNDDAFGRRTGRHLRVNRLWTSYSALLSLAVLSERARMISQSGQWR
ncbi:MAG: hypothetical protein WKF81_03600 [Thermomicrobiales bacterium]